MPQEYIKIRGARENNLKNVSLQIPKRKITVFTGVSGSGKSSIVFDTISSEAQRLLNETFTAFVRNRLPRHRQPDVDMLENLSTAIVIDQKRLGGNSRSTLGTITDLYAVLRLLFSRVGQPFVGYSNVFSFNDPQGMCPECQGIGKKVELDLKKLLDTTKSLNEGAVLFPIFSVDSWYLKNFTMSGFFDNDKKLEDYTEAEWELLLYGREGKVKYPSKGGPVESDFEGLVLKFNRLYIQRDSSELSERTLNHVKAFITHGPCSLCKGTRLSQEALSCKILGYNIAELAALEIGELRKFILEIKEPMAASMVTSLTERLGHLIDMGLDYLTLSRETTTLSGGESQRVKMVRHLGSSLTDMMYVFDEPSVGLHPRDVHRLNGMLLKLRDKGNTVLIVEHDRDVIEIADHVVDVGPNAGSRGGEIVFEGTVEQLNSQEATLTGRYMKRCLPIKPQVRTPAGRMRITNANHHNLQNVTVDVPEGVLTVVTGVAGSGKSSLIHHAFLSQYPDAVVIDQSAVSTSIRSNPATFTGIMDDIRGLFAKQTARALLCSALTLKGLVPIAADSDSSTRIWHLWRASSPHAIRVMADASRIRCFHTSLMER